MAESQKFGTHSLVETIQSERLREVAFSKPINEIHKALGSTTPFFLVGGAVRDILLGKEKLDLDVASPLRVSEILERLEVRGLKVIPTGISHGTVLCVVDGEHVEITEFRGPNHGSLEEDLARRDFTINAIAYDIAFRKLVDPFGGISDLRNGIVRAVGDPLERFKEDPLRILRMVRFGPANNRELENNTREAAIVLAQTLTGVSVERIREELTKIILSPAADGALRSLHLLNLLSVTLPELIPTVGFEQNKFHVHDVFDHTLDVLSKCPIDRVLRWTALYHDIGKAHTLSVDEDGERHFYEHERVSAEICEKSMERLKFSNEDIHSVSKLVRYHMRPLNCGPSGVRRLLRDLGPLFLKWREFKNADRPAVFDDDLLEQLKVNFDQMVEAEKSRAKGSVYGKLAITGDDLIELGLKPGKLLGSILDTLKNEVLENPDRNEKEVLLSRARELISN